jgi:hypothetical protein
VHARGACTRAGRRAQTRRRSSRTPRAAAATRHAAAGRAWLTVLRAAADNADACRGAAARAAPGLQPRRVGAAGQCSGPEWRRVAAPARRRRR